MANLIEMCSLPVNVKCFMCPFQPQTCRDHQWETNKICSVISPLGLIYSFLTFVFLYGRRLGGAAVLMCIILACKCVVPICPRSFPGRREESARSSWSETILWTINSVSEPYAALWCVGIAPYFFRRWRFLYPFLVMGASHTHEHTQGWSVSLGDGEKGHDRRYLSDLMRPWI